MTTHWCTACCAATARHWSTLYCTGGSACCVATARHWSTLYCTGGSACCVATARHWSTLYCTGGSACCAATARHWSTLYCTGGSACGAATARHWSTLYCTGGSACGAATACHWSTLYCTGGSACGAAATACRWSTLYCTGGSACSAATAACHWSTLYCTGVSACSAATARRWSTLYCTGDPRVASSRLLHVSGLHYTPTQYCHYCTGSPRVAVATAWRGLHCGAPPATVTTVLALPVLRRLLHRVVYAVLLLLSLLHWRSPCCVGYCTAWCTLYSYYCHYCTGASRRQRCVATVPPGLRCTLRLLRGVTVTTECGTSAPRVVHYAALRTGVVYGTAGSCYCRLLHCTPTQCCPALLWLTALALRVLSRVSAATARGLHCTPTHIATT